MRIALILAAALALSSAADGGAFAGRDGLIVFSRTAPSAATTLVTVDPATGVQRTLGTASEPAWSPDGTKLAYVRAGQVYVAASDGSGETLVGPGQDPAWSPDGTELVVSRYDGKPLPDHPEGTLQLVVIDLATGAATQLTDSSIDVRFPAWSPDGSTIAFATPTALGTMPASGGSASPLNVPGASVDGGPSWSPDGRQLAFVDSGGQVWTVAPDGSGGHQLTYTLGPPAQPNVDTRPAWSPDGTAIAFTSGSDLCVTDRAGSVRRVTRTPQSTAPDVAALPDWQPSASGSAAIFTPPPSAADSIGCDWNPGPRIEVLDANILPSIVSVAAPGPVFFVNHLAEPVTVTTTMRGARATVQPGRFAGIPTVPGEFDFQVSGYPDGVPRRGSLVVKAAGALTLDQHAAIRYGTATVLTGQAAGPAGATVTVTAKPEGAAAAVRVATVKPVGGRWTLSVAPKITTSYHVAFAGATADRVLRVMPTLRVSHGRSTIAATLTPAAKLRGKRLYLFRTAGRGWSQYRSAAIGGTGTVVFRSVPPGRYYVGYQGAADYWGTATDPFTVRS